MKNFFLINPVAGKGTDTSFLAEKINKTCLERQAEFYVHKTTGPGDARAFAEKVALENFGEQVRIFACGGDGTLGEAVNGAAGHKNAAVGVIPTGTGNDFVRNFTRGELFSDIGAQLDGSVFTADLIRANGRYCANMINIGFDSETVAATVRLKQKYRFPVGFAYTLGMLATLIKKPGVSMEITAAGQAPQSFSLLLCTFANGAFCGGGYMSNPRANPSDGIIDCLLVDNVTRRKFISLVGQYKKGTHINEKNSEIIRNISFENAYIDFGAPRNISIDGELVTERTLRLETAGGALRFILPQGSSPNIAQKNTAYASIS